MVRAYEHSGLGWLRQSPFFHQRRVKVLILIGEHRPFSADGVPSDSDDTFWVVICKPRWRVAPYTVRTEQVRYFSIPVVFLAMSELVNGLVSNLRHSNMIDIHLVRSQSIYRGPGRFPLGKLRLAARQNGQNGPRLHVGSMLGGQYLGCTRYMSECE